MMSKGFKNAFFGILSQLLTSAVGIIIPRLVLVSLGSEANGLHNSVSSILSYMSLLEAGVGTATLQALYKPCARRDRDSINSIMAATDQFYCRTGKIYLLIVAVLSCCYALLVRTELPRLDVFAVVLLAGLSGVLSYFFQGKFKIFLTAEGKSYVKANVGTVVYIAASIGKAALLYAGFGVVAVQVSAFVFDIAQTVFYMLYMRRRYPWLDLKVKPDLDAISQRNAVMVHQIAGMIFTNTDVLILTIFTSLKEVSVYTMYAMIFGLIRTIAAQLYDSHTYALGQAYNTDRKQFMRMFDVFEVLTILLTFWLYCVCRVMINPFLALYTVGVSDINYVDPYMPWLFAAFYLLHNARTSSDRAITIAQHFKKTQGHAILESVINVTVSVVCVNLFGIYGVLMGTIAALLYRTNIMIIYASRILGRSCLIAYKRWFLNLAVFAGLSLAADQVSLPAANYGQWVLSATAVTVVMFVGFLAANAVFEWKNIRLAGDIAKRTVCRLFKRG